MIIPDHALGLPVLRALSLCTCRRHYPGAAAGCIPRSSHPAVSAFPDSTIVSACTSSFSRFARRSLALQPAHSRGHQFVTSYPKASDISSPPCLLRLLPAGANRRVGLAPTGKRRLVTAHTRSEPWLHRARRQRRSWDLPHRAFRFPAVHPDSLWSVGVPLQPRRVGFTRRLEEGL